MKICDWHFFKWTGIFELYSWEGNSIGHWDCTIQSLHLIFYTRIFSLICLGNSNNSGNFKARELSDVPGVYPVILLDWVGGRRWISSSLTSLDLLLAGLISGWWLILWHDVRFLLLKQKHSFYFPTNIIEYLVPTKV